MKKLTLIAALLAVSLLSAHFAMAQSSDTTTTTKKRKASSTSATITSRNSSTLNERLRRIEAASHTFTTTPQQTSRIDGSVSRAARSGNPLQMVNPLAPKEYGDGSDVTRRESDDPYQRPQGLRLFAWSF